MKEEYKLHIIDAKLMSKLHPKTFKAPSQEELDKIKINSNVKICVSNERFWVKVTKTDNDLIIGTINNDLVNTKKHGLKFDDIVEFEKNNIFQIYNPSEL